MDQIQHKFIDVRGVKLHYAETGTGPAVVFLHGFPEIWYSWRHQMIAAANVGFRTIALDLRGYGLSEKHPQLEKATFNDFVEDTLAILDSCQIDKVFHRTCKVCAEKYHIELNYREAFLIGKDFGALPIYLLSILHPTRVSAVVSLGVPFFPHRPNRFQGLPEGFYVTRWKESGRAEADFSRFSVKTVLQNIYILFSRSEIPIAEKDQEIMDVVDSSTPLPPWLSEEDLSTYASLYENSGFSSSLQVPYRSQIRDFPISDPKVQVPALLIMGGKDYILKFPGIEDYITSGKVNHYMPYLETKFLSDGTHFMQEQFPEEVNKMIISFLKQHV